MTGELLAKSGEAAKSGPIGLAIILILCIVCYFLFKSLSKHLKTVRENFPTDPPAGRPARTEATSDASVEAPAASIADTTADPPPPAAADHPAAEPPSA
jgi:hypothetical protein